MEAERKGSGWATFSSLLVAFVVMMIRIRASLTIRCLWGGWQEFVGKHAAVFWKVEGVFALEDASKQTLIILNLIIYMLLAMFILLF